MDIIQNVDWPALRKHVVQREPMIHHAILNNVNTPLDDYGNYPLHLAVAHHDYLLTLVLLQVGMGVYQGEENDFLQSKTNNLINVFIQAWSIA